jgi:hypothetical protein
MILEIGTFDPDTYLSRWRVSGALSIVEMQGPAERADKNHAPRRSSFLSYS